jgi:Uma2 family endonuclease
MNVAVTLAADGFARRAFSAADLRRMIDAGILGEDERVELVEGELVMMPSKGYAHELIKNELTVVIARALPPTLHMGVEMTVQFSDNTILEPDIVVFERAGLIRSQENFSHLGPRAVRLAIEVAWSSLVYDRRLKARLYAKHAVEEYWVVDANERVTYVHSGPSDEGWASIVERAPNVALTTPSLPEFSITLADIA